MNTASLTILLTCAGIFLHAKGFAAEAIDAGKNICAVENIADLNQALSEGASPNARCVLGKDPQIPYYLNASPYWELMRKAVNRGQNRPQWDADYENTEAMGRMLVSVGSDSAFENVEKTGKLFHVHTTVLSNFDVAVRNAMPQTLNVMFEKGFRPSPEVAAKSLAVLANIRWVAPFEKGLHAPMPVPSQRHYRHAAAAIQMILALGYSPNNIPRDEMDQQSKYSVLYYMLSGNYPGDVLLDLIDKWDFSKDTTPSMEDFIDAATRGDQSDLVIEALKRHAK